MKNTLAAVIGSLLISLYAFAQTDANPQKDVGVDKNQTGWWSEGLFVGVPQKASMKGKIYKTPEVEFGVGNFPDDARYMGSTEEMSIQNQALYDRLDNLSKTGSSKAYVFKYGHYYPLNMPISAHEHETVVLGYRNMHTNFAGSGLPTKMVLNHDPGGNYSKGSRSGRIIGVERWGWSVNHCTATIESGGIRQEDRDTDTTKVQMNIWSEEQCQYAEHLIYYGVKVNIGYREEYFEIWDAHDHNVTEISVINDESGQSVTPTSTTHIEMDEATYQKLKARLMKDTAVVNSLKRSIRDLK